MKGRITREGSLGTVNVIFADVLVIMIEIETRKTWHTY